MGRILPDLIQSISTLLLGLSVFAASSGFINCKITYIVLAVGTIGSIGNIASSILKYRTSRLIWQSKFWLIFSINLVAMLFLYLQLIKMFQVALVECF